MYVSNKIYMHFLYKYSNYIKLIIVRKIFFFKISIIHPLWGKE